MTDVEALRQRDKEFSIEEKLICCVWVHDRYIHGKSYDDIQRDFELRFNKKAPKHDLLIMWERNAFNSGSVNFNDNYHMMMANGSGSGTSGSASGRSQSPPPIYPDSKSTFNSHRSYSNSNSSGSPNEHYHRSSVASSATLPAKRSKPTLHPSPSFPKNFNPALYKTEMCRQYGETGRCEYGEKCLFAHGYRELKSLPNFRTAVCTNWINGYCPYASNCMFVHPDRSNRRGSGSSGQYNRPPNRASKMARIGP